MLAENVCTNTQHMRLMLVSFFSEHVPRNNVICGAASMRCYPSIAQASGDRHSWVCSQPCAQCSIAVKSREVKSRNGLHDVCLPLEIGIAVLYCGCSFLVSHRASIYT